MKIECSKCGIKAGEKGFTGIIIKDSILCITCAVNRPNEVS